MGRLDEKTQTNIIDPNFLYFNCVYPYIKVIHLFV